MAPDVETNTQDIEQASPNSAKVPEKSDVAPPSTKPSMIDSKKGALADASNDAREEASAVTDADAAKPKKKKRPADVAVRLRGVVKKFGSKIAVDDVSLQIRSGHVYGLIGPNGAGKTTTFSMMAGYLKPTNGDIEMLGFAPTQTNELKSRVGVLPQDALLPPMEKVGEFLVHMARLQAIPSNKAPSVVRAVLEEIEGRDWWNVRCGALSHGMAKRVQLAQALLGDPEVVLLDEPTSGLDPRSAYEVRQLIKGRKGRCTLVVSSHNLQELEEICDAAAILDRGKVVASGTMSELTAASEEVHVKIAPPPRGAAEAPYRRNAGGLPLSKLRELTGVSRVEYDDARHEIVVHFDRAHTDAESIIGQTLWVLLNGQVRISGVTKGRGLEKRVMDLTDDPDHE